MFLLQEQCTFQIWYWSIFDLKFFKIINGPGPWGPGANKKTKIKTKQNRKQQKQKQTNKKTELRFVNRMLSGYTACLKVSKKEWNRPCTLDGIH